MGSAAPPATDRVGHRTAVEGSTKEQLLAGMMPDQLVANTVFVGALALVLGAPVMGSEHTGGTLKTLLTQRPGHAADRARCRVDPRHREPHHCGVALDADVIVGAEGRPPGVNSGSLIGSILPSSGAEGAPGVNSLVSGGRGLSTVLVYLAVAVVAAAFVTSRRDVA